MTLFYNNKKCIFLKFVALCHQEGHVRGPGEEMGLDLGVRYLRLSSRLLLGDDYLFVDQPQNVFGLMSTIVVKELVI